MTRPGFCGACVTVLLSMSAGTPALAQDASTVREFWPELSVRYQWPSSLSQAAYTQIQNEEGYPTRQWNIGTDLSYQAKRISRPHLVNIDPSKEHAYVIGVGYEYLDTQGSASPKYENRLKAEATGRHRPSGALLIEDRNRFEFRWVNGAYSSRYRNRLRVEVDVRHNAFRYTPYLSAEVFYDWSKDSWNEAQYSIGIQWPYRRTWVLDTYYLRQNCTTCDTEHLNVAGVSLKFFLGTRR